MQSLLSYQKISYGNSFSITLCYESETAISETAVSQRKYSILYWYDQAKWQEFENSAETLYISVQFSSSWFNFYFILGVTTSYSFYFKRKDAEAQRSLFKSLIETWRVKRLTSVLRCTIGWLIGQNSAHSRHILSNGRILCVAASLHFYNKSLSPNSYL